MLINPFKRLFSRIRKNKENTKSKEKQHKNLRNKQSNKKDLIKKRPANKSESFVYSVDLLNNNDKT